ncbi:MAG: helix-turn-helix transcriptional regulator [Rikenellaceae bacterium]|nr:helix-turn-helix transcriptional regulator [Rikenellaceae bacterium]
MINQRHNELLMGRVAKKLKELRIGRDLTQAEVYRQTKIHIGRIEAGNANITVSSLSELCKFYGVSFGDFFEGIGTK